jgi:putative transposase
MGKSRHTETQIIAALKRLEVGRTGHDVAREQGLSQATIYAWKPKYGGMAVSEAQRLPSLEDEELASEASVGGPESGSGDVKAVIAKYGLSS